MTNAISRPSLLWFLSEPGRALFELGISFPYNKVRNLVDKKTQGDNHPVLVVPGFMSSERSTKILRKFIKDLGYDVYDWGLGRNVGKIEYLELLLERVDEIHKKTGKNISLIGWSLGGVFARQIAKERPEIVEQVITLGSPFAGLTEPNNAEWMYRIITGGKKVKHVNQTFLENLPSPAPVPTTAVYSKEDGVVAWQICMEAEEDKLHQNIQVRGSHIGLGVNPSVLSIVADRLALKKNNWQKIKSEGIFDNKLIYPSLGKEN